MKHKTIFSIVLITAIAALSIGTGVAFHELRGNDEIVRTRMAEELSDDVLYFVIGELDQHHIVSLDDIDQSKKIEKQNGVNQKYEYFNEWLRQEVEYVNAVYYDDSNLQFVIRDSDTKKILVSSKAWSEEGKDNSSFYGTIHLNKDGTMQMEGDFKKGYYTTLKSFNDILLRDYDSILYDNVLKFPNNMEITMRVPTQIVANQRNIASTLTDLNAYVPYTVLAMLLSGAILCLLILFYPIRIVEQCQPFKTFARLKFELAFILGCIVLGFGGLGLSIYGGSLMSGYMEESLAQIGINNGYGWLMAGNVILYALFYLYIAVVIFQIKRIFTTGLRRYLKEDTVVGSLLRWFKRYIEMLAKVEMKDANRSLIKLLLINLVIVIFLCSMWAFGIFFAIIYTIAVFFWLKNKLDRVQGEYQCLLDSAKAMQEGDFENAVKETGGTFTEMQQELAKVRCGFEKAVQEETKSQLMKTELISNVSHDLKTPLTGMRNYVELLQDDQLDGEARKRYMDMLQQYIERFTRLIEDLFEVSKVNSGNMRLDVMELDLKALIEQAQAECSDALQEKHLQVCQSFDQEEYRLLLDGEKTIRVFENLYMNVAKYAMENTRVYVDVHHQDSRVVIIMKNISAAPLNFDANEITERFQRGDSSRHGEGSGLGLAIVKSFVEIQKGSFHIEIDGDLFKAVLAFPMHDSDRKETNA